MSIFLANEIVSDANPSLWLRQGVPRGPEMRNTIFDTEEACFVSPVRKLAQIRVHTGGLVGPAGSQTLAPPETATC